MTTAIITLAILAAGYLAGRLHGKAAHHRFLTRGFRLMAAAAERDSVQFKSTYELVVRPVDVSNAFSRQEDIDWRVRLADGEAKALAALDLLRERSRSLREQGL